MDIVLVRVDDRLIHGQILESWIPSLNVQSVVVANDCLAHDQFQRAILSMAIPDRINLSIVPVDDIRLLEHDAELDGKITLIIVSSIRDAYRLHECGLAYDKLNLGNMKGGSSATQISYSMWVSDDDVERMKALVDAGVLVTLQSVPREREVDLKSILQAVNSCS